MKIPLIVVAAIMMVAAVLNGMGALWTLSMGLGILVGMGIAYIFLK